MKYLRSFIIKDLDKKAYLEFATIMKELASFWMPFGKYGPSRFPPNGIKVYDLPYDYLAYFARKGFPNGKLGRLLEFVYFAKRDGADAMFDPLRKLAGGRCSLRVKSQRRWNFADENVID